MGKGVVMKKIIILIVVVVVILILLKIMGIGFSVSSSPDKQKTIATGEFLSNDYIFWTYKDIIGFSLPEGASEIYHKKYLATFMKASNIFRDNSSTEYVHSTKYVYCWVVAKLPEEDFYILIENHGLEEMPNMLKSQPDILQLYEDASFSNWDINNRTIEDVYFNESSDHEEYIACAYKDGKIYIKKAITYIQYGDENEKMHYEKAARDK